MKKVVTLNNGIQMPNLGFGMWQTPDGEVAINSVIAAIEAGYTHIDTAQMYRNEGSVGEGIVQSGKPRAELFITTKLSNRVRGYEETKVAIDESLKLLQTDYIDLMLLHWPNPLPFRADWKGANAASWQAMEEYVAAGKIRAIGISNFMPHHLDALMETAKIKPAVNQVFLAPGELQPEVQAACAKYDIVLEAYSPLGTGKIFDVPEMIELAEKYNKTIAQVAIRWSLQHGFVPLPKSVTPSRIIENLDVYDFEISAEDMAKIDALDGVVGKQKNPDDREF